MANPSLISLAEPIAGTVFLTVDATTYILGARVRYSVAKVARTTRAGLSGVYGYNEAPRPCFIAAEIIDRGNLRVEDFTDMTSVTVKVELINGKTVVLYGAWTTEPTEIDAAEGTGDVRWESGNGRELVT